MSVWGLLFPDKEARERRANEEAEIRERMHDRQDTTRAVQSNSRLMMTMAGASRMMARGDNEDH